MTPAHRTDSVKAMREVPGLVRQLYALAGRLEQLFPGRRFTLDGHLVGSIGEVLAAYAYGLNLLPNSTAGHDAQTADGLLVQIKATQVNSVALCSEPVHLLVLKLKPSGEFCEVYNGPGSQAWDNAGKMQKNGQRPIRCSRLERLMLSVSEDQRIRLADQPGSHSEAVADEIPHAPQGFVAQLKLMGAVKMFELGKLSSGKAAELTGLSRVDFLEVCGRYKVSPFNYSDEEVETELRSDIEAARKGHMPV